MSHQFAFTDLIEEMEAAEHARIDAHRTRVQDWFEALPVDHKQQLCAMFMTSEWLTCQALSAAVGDHHRSRAGQRPT